MMFLISVFKWIILSVSFLVLASCSTVPAPSVFNEEDNKVALNELNQLKEISEPNSTKKIIENRSTGTVRKSDIANESTKKKEPVSREQVVGEYLESIQNKTKNLLNDKKSNLKKSLKKPKNQQNKQNIETKKEEKETYALTPAEKILQDANYKIVQQKELKTEDFKELCNETKTILPNYNSLTRLVVVCNWSLPNILKINKIREPKDFNPNKALILPPKVFQNVATNEVYQALDNYNCSKENDLIEGVGKFNFIVKKCYWDSNKLKLVNNLTVSDLKEENFNRVILPVGLIRLSERFYGESKKYPLNFQKKAKEPKKKKKTSSISTPQWCKQKNYLLTKPQNLINIAEICYLDDDLLSLINNLSSFEVLPKGTPIKLPSIINKKIKRKKYQIPLNPKVCQRDIYTVENGISIGKIATTCQWNYKYILLLNQLSNDSIIKVGQKLILPNALFKPEPYFPEEKGGEEIEETQIQKIEQPSSTSINVSDYKKLCDKNIYQPLPKDNLKKLAETCNFNYDRLFAINYTGRVYIKNLLPKYILLPKAVDDYLAKLKKQNSNSTIKTNDFKYAMLCSQKKIKLPPKATLELIANNCAWNLDYIKLLNGLQNSNTIDRKKPIMLPPSLYEDFGKINDWQWPIKNRYRFRINKTDKGLQIYTSANEPVFNVQKGTVLYILRSTQKDKFQVIVRHSKGYLSIYDNLVLVNYTSGQMVEQGAELGLLDSQSEPAILRYLLYRDGESLSVVETFGKRK